ncbi:MAG: cyclic nucleotide-gated ion channel [Xanthobacteraceae bacterium]
MNARALHALTDAITRLRYFVLPIGLICVAVGTMPGLPFASLHWVETILWFCWFFFVIEWAHQVLLWRLTAPPRPSLPWPGQVASALAVSLVPIAYLIGLPPATAWLFASVWLLKIPAGLSGFSLLHRAFVSEARPLTSVIIVFLIVLFSAAVVMHLIERDVQPNAFGTLPQSLYWAVTTLSTTGYGDVVPVTHLGRLIAGLVMISGLAVFGLWTGIIANGFAAEARRRDFTRTWEYVAQVPFFKQLTPAAIIEIARMLRAMEVAERTVIVRKGRHGDSMFFIAGGEVEIVGTNPPVRLGEGAFFGELALLGDGVRTATVVATMSTTLLVLEVADYRIFAAHHPELAKTVEEEGFRRLAEIKANRERAAHAHEMPPPSSRVS